MIYELRTYTLTPGAVPRYLELAEAVGWPARRHAYGRNHGYWTSESGTLNQIWHLWSFDSYAERTRLRAELANNPRWTLDYVPAIQPLIEREDLRLLNALIDPRSPSGSGNVYEICLYRVRVGGRSPWTAQFQAVLPVRERHSSIVGLWTGEFPQPNEAVHLWAYPDLNARTTALTSLAQDPAWQAFLATSAPLLAEMQSVLLLPTSYSPMQ